MPVGGTGAGWNTGLSVLPTKVTKGSLSVGSALTVSGDLIAADLSQVSRALGTPVAAVLGADALKALLVVVNPVRGWIAFGVPGHLDITSNSETAGKLLSGKKAAAMGLRQSGPANIPFGRNFVVSASIDGQPVQLAIDYGNVRGIVLRDDVWRRVISPEARARQTSTSTRGDGPHTETQVGTAKEFKLGNVTATNVNVFGSAAFHDLPFESLLGLAVLGSTATVIDMPRQQLWLFPAGEDISVSAA